VLNRLGVSDLGASQVLRHAHVKITQDHYIKQTALDRLNTMAILEKSQDEKFSGHYRPLKVGLRELPRTINLCF
jgi:hypothetical protein